MVTVRLVARPRECTVRRVRAIDSDDDPVGAAVGGSAAHHRHRARTVPDNVAGGTAEPKRSRAVVAAGTNDDQVLSTGTVDQRDRSGLGRSLGDDLDTRFGLGDHFLDPREPGLARFEQ